MLKMLLPVVSKESSIGREFVGKTNRSPVVIFDCLPKELVVTQHLLPGYLDCHVISYGNQTRIERFVVKCGE